MEKSTLTKFPSITIFFKNMGDDGQIIGVETSEEMSSTDVISTIFGCLVNECDVFIKDHPTSCNCNALKFAKKISGLGKYILQNGLDN